MSEHLAEDHPCVIALLEKLQGQYATIGKISSFVGYVNVEYLRAELYQIGWNTWLADDGKTVVLEAVRGKQ